MKPCFKIVDQARQTALNYNKVNICLQWRENSADILTRYYTFSKDINTITIIIIEHFFIYKLLTTPVN